MDVRELLVMQDKAEVDQKIYGTTIIPRFKLKTATTKTTISAGITFRSFIARRYGCAEIVSVQNCTVPTLREEVIDCSKLFSSRKQSPRARPLSRAVQATDNLSLPSRYRRQHSPPT